MNAETLNPTVQAILSRGVKLVPFMSAPFMEATPIERLTPELRQALLENGAEVHEIIRELFDLVYADETAQTFFVCAAAIIDGKLTLAGCLTREPSEAETI
jgi:hypothetical protein